jgi:hypothetical protein
VDLLRRAGRQRRLLARLGTRREPDPELTPQDQAVVVRDRRRSLRPDQARWTPMADLPSRRFRFHLHLAWTGGAVVELSTNTAYDPDGDRWLPLPKPPSLASPPLSSAGPERALVQMVDTGSTDGAIHLYVLEPAKLEP